MKITECCEQLLYAVISEEVPFLFIPKFREFGILVLDGGSSIIRATHCPWCGVVLPESLREEWFAKIEELGFEAGDENIPSMYSDETWYLQNQIRV